MVYCYWSCKGSSNCPFAPENDPSGIRDKVLNELALANLIQVLLI